MASAGLGLLLAALLLPSAAAQDCAGVELDGSVAAAKAVLACVQGRTGNAAEDATAEELQAHPIAASLGSTCEEFASADGCCLLPTIGLEMCPESCAEEGGGLDDMVEDKVRDKVDEKIQDVADGLTPAKVMDILRKVAMGTQALLSISMTSGSCFFCARQWRLWQSWKRMTKKHPALQTVAGVADDAAQLFKACAQPVFRCLGAIRAAAAAVLCFCCRRGRKPKVAAAGLPQSGDKADADEDEDEDEDFDTSPFAAEIAALKKELLETVEMIVKKKKAKYRQQVKDYLRRKLPRDSDSSDPELYPELEPVRRWPEYDRHGPRDHGGAFGRARRARTPPPVLRRRRRPFSDTEEDDV